MVSGIPDSCHNRCLQYALSDRYTGYTPAIQFFNERLDFLSFSPVPPSLSGSNFFFKYSF